MNKPLEGKRIYLMDDSPENVYVLIKLLESYDAIPIVAWWFTGESNRMLEKMPIDLILLDLMLPDQRTGIDVLAEIRSVPELAHIPVVAVSAADPSVYLSRVRSAGFNGFISKPIDPSLFSQQLATILSGTPLWVTL